MTNGDRLLEKFGEGTFKVVPFDINWMDSFIIHVERLVIVKNGKKRTTANLCGLSEEIDKERYGDKLEWYEMPANAIRGFGEIFNEIELLEDSALSERDAETYLHDTCKCCERVHCSQCGNLLDCLKKRYFGMKSEGITKVVFASCPYLKEFVIK